mgnify:CR=1 FL=1
MASNRLFNKKKNNINMRKPSDYIRKLAMIKELYLKDYVFELSEALGVPAEKLMKSKAIQKYYDWVRKQIKQ